jgi:hypothetical protein
LHCGRPNDPWAVGKVKQIAAYRAGEGHPQFNWNSARGAAAEFLPGAPETVVVGGPQGHWLLNSSDSTFIDRGDSKASVGAADVSGHDPTTHRHRNCIGAGWLFAEEYTQYVEAAFAIMQVPA